MNYLKTAQNLRVAFPTRFNGEMLKLIKLNAVNDLKGHVQHKKIEQNMDSYKLKGRNLPKNISRVIDVADVSLQIQIKR